MSIGMKRCIADVDAANLSERSRLSRLLLVEDNDSLLVTLKAILEDEGFAVTGCATATEALVQIQQQKYGIAVVDLKLPDMQGTQLLKKFRDLGSKVRVIINTAYGGFESAKDAVNSGAFAYLEKATDPSELVREVHRANRSHFERYAEDLEAAVAERTMELSESEVRLRLIIDNSPVGLLHEDFSEVQKWIDILREEGVEDIQEYLENNADAVAECFDLVKILDVNPAALKLHEASNKNELIESLARTFCKESYHTFRDELIALSDGRTSFESDAVVKTLSGEKRDVMLRMFVDENAPNWSSSYIAVTDITERKRAEAEVCDAVRRRDEFLAVLSHELRNPLAAILNATSVLSEDEVSEETDLEAREVIERHVRHLARLLDDLLDMPRATHDKVRLHRDVFDIRSLMMDVVRCVQPQIDQKRQQLHIRIPDEPLRVNGDVGRLLQVQVNLLVNASKYTGEGGTIEYMTLRENHEAVIRVRDNGAGISESSIRNIFEPFTQTEQTLDRSQGGMGLGLPLVRMIVEAHGGTVLAVSEGRAHGSEFTIRLPFSDAPQSPRTEDPTVDFRGKKILIVEDNPGIFRMLARSMEIKGLDVAMAADGRDALEVFGDFDPDFAVIDIGLPILNGFEVARTIRSQPQFGDVVLVAVTGYGQENDHKKALAAGFDLHLVKPIDPDEILRVIAAHYMSVM